MPIKDKAKAGVKEMEFAKMLQVAEKKKVSEVVDNSKNVVPGSVFVCIKGFKSDGHNFVADALSKGAKYIVTERDLGLSSETQIIVKNTRRALADLAHVFYDNPSKKLNLIGVTGTNGKTSTVFMLHHILSPKNAGLLSTVKTMIGEEKIPQERTTPEALEIDQLLVKMIENNTRYAVMEVSSHSVVLERVAGLHFVGGIFTNLSQDHLDFHQNMEEYARAKQEFFSLLKNDSVAVFNADDPYGEFMVEKTPGRKIGFGLKNGIVQAKDIAASATSIKYTLTIEKKEWPVNLAIGGEFNVENSLGALALCYGLGIDLDFAISRLATFPGVPGRFENVALNHDFAVIVDYAHTPDGLENLLSSAKKQCQGRLIVVFGCGGDRDKTKRPKMGQEVEKWADVIIVTSDNPRTEEPMSIIQDILPGIKEKPYIVEADRKKAIFLAIESAKPKDIVVIAGKGHEDYQEINGVKYHFDDREVAREGLKKFAKNQC